MTRLMRIVRESHTKIGYREVRGVLGENFVSPEDIGRAKGINYGRKLLKQLAETLPPEDVLQWLRENEYVLVAGSPLPMSSSGVQQTFGLPVRLVRIGKLTFSQENEIASALRGIQDRISAGWLMFRKVPCLDSVHKVLEDQRSLLSQVEYVPNLAEAMWCIAACKAVHNIKLFPHILVRTASTLNGNSLHIGEVTDDGAVVGSSWRTFKSIVLGIASARK